MTTPTGQISWSNIAAEFGAPPSKNLGAYRVNQSIAGKNWPLDTGVPSSGTISFSNLRGKTCNVVVDYSGAPVLSNGTQSIAGSTTITHVFNNEANTTTSLTYAGAGGIVVEPRSVTDSDSPHQSTTVNVAFAVGDNGGEGNTVFFEPVKSEFSSSGFSINAGNFNVTKSVVPLLVYRVRVTNPGSGLNQYTSIRIAETNSEARTSSAHYNGKRGWRIWVEDASDGDWNDVAVTIKEEEDRDTSLPGWSNNGGTFFRADEKIYFVYYDADSLVNQPERKHYLVTLNDGTTIPESDTNVETIEVTANLITLAGNQDGLAASEEGQMSGAGAVANISVSKKQRVSNNSFKVWFYSDADRRVETGSVGNTFCRQFSIATQSTITTSGVSTAKSAYESAGAVIGGFRTVSSLSSGANTTKKVYHVIRRKIGNGLDSGEWETGTQLNFIVTSSGKIYGKGGNGGTGGKQDTNASSNPSNFGGDGGHGLTLRYTASVIVESGGEIKGGGGGGGGGSYSYVPEPDKRSAGGGGGGGQGWPGGAGGRGGPTPAPSGAFGGRNVAGAPGSSGSETSAGTGGPGGGGSDYEPARGGDGGAWGTAGERGVQKDNIPGEGGLAGKAINKVGGATVNLSNNGGTIIGAT